jgi:hypothetical protein
MEIPNAFTRSLDMSVTPFGTGVACDPDVTAHLDRHLLVGVASLPGRDRRVHGLEVPTGEHPEFKAYRESVATALGVPIVFIGETRLVDLFMRFSPPPEELG